MMNYFDSQSVAIIGASRKPEKLGHQVLKNLIKNGYKGRIYPINLDDKEILKIKAYASVLDVHSKIDLAVIIVPREIVPNVLKQCVHKEIPYVLIISAGFAEKDLIGKNLQKELSNIIKNTKTKIIGPNCLGLVDSVNKMNLTFAASEIIPGNIGLILQSGAIGSAIFDWAKENNIGFSKFISLGNKISVNEIDCLNIYFEDKNTKAIAIYLEDISNPQEFLKVARKITKYKPIIILKGGDTLEGSKAASSHTGAVSSPVEITNALFVQSNMIVAENYDELKNYLEIFQNKNLEIEKNVAIISNAGGPAILAVDAVQKYALNNLGFDNNINEKLKKSLTNYASLKNPLDLGGDALSLDYDNALNIILKDNIFKTVFVIVTPQSMTDLENIAGVLTKYSKENLIVAVLMGGDKIENAVEILRDNHVPLFDDPEIAIKTISGIYNYKKGLYKNDEEIEIKSIQQQNYLNESEIIEKYSLPYAKYYEVNTDAEIMGHLEHIGYPLVFKAPKTKGRGKAGRVGLNLSNHEALENAVKVIGLPGVIQEMIDSPFEVIIGARRHPKFGISLLFGQGGIFVEEFDDINIKILPLTHNDLEEMIKMTKVWKNIEKFGVKELIKDFILKTAKIIIENTDISEIEFNPIKILPNRIVAVDINIKRI